jgi:hypothetical protein
MQPIALMQSIVIAWRGTFSGDGVVRSAVTMCAQSPGDAAGPIEEVTEDADTGITCTVAPKRKAKPLSSSTKRLRTATDITQRE